MSPRPARLPRHDERLGTHMRLEKLRDSAARASRLLKAMSNQNRLMILCQLAHDGEKCVGDLERVIGLSQSALSQHLARLRRDGLVKTRRSAQTIYYSLSGDEADAVIDILYRLYCEEGTSQALNREPELGNVAAAS